MVEEAMEFRGVRGRGGEPPRSRGIESSSALLALCASPPNSFFFTTEVVGFKPFKGVRIFSSLTDLTLFVKNMAEGMSTRLSII